jgi:hypothetical protein
MVRYFFDSLYLLSQEVSLDEVTQLRERGTGFKIIFRKMLKCAGFLGVAYFFGRPLNGQRYAFVSEVRWTRTLNTNVVSLHKLTAF